MRCAARLPTHAAGVTNATLSDRLKQLEDSGLIERRKYQDHPGRYEYLLTRRGLDTVLLTQALAQIGDKWATADGDRVPLRFVDRNTGRPVKLALVDAQSRQPVNAADVLPVEGPGADDLIRWRLAHLRR